MNAQYRQMIVDGEMAPVSQLSSAFLAPKTPLHLQFAYFQSAMVVEFLVERFGLDALQQILVDLGEGLEINEALIRNTLPLGELDNQFATYAEKRVEDWAPKATWEELELPASADSAALAAFLKDHPQNAIALQRYARRLITEKKFAEALEAAQRLLELQPEDISAENAYMMIAVAHHELGNTAEERKALEALTSRDGDATDAHHRLMEIGEEAEDWQCVADNSRRLLAVNPLIVAPHRSLAKAAEELGLRDDAIRSYRALLKFETTDLAHTHFRLAALLNEKGDTDAAKRQVLMALDAAPRFREAHQLLLELAGAEKTPDGAKSNGDKQ
jgi:tetratricopeptide (TPR) repeat protein